MIITHPRFNRPKVEQPCPRRRKGTTDLGKVRRKREYMIATYGSLDPADDARPAVPLGRDWIQVAIHGDIDARRLMRALQSEGLTLAGGAIIDWPLDPEDIRLTDQIKKIINDLTAEELVEALEAIKAIKARWRGVSS